MDLFNIITFLITLCAIFSYINIRFFKLPFVIGLMVIAIVFSILMLLTNYVDPQLYQYAEAMVEQINFSTVLLNVMLSFLLFAGALHTDGSLLRKESRTIILFSVLGVLISTFIIASLLYVLVLLTGNELGFIYCLLFGALISPTDPIAVVGILTKAGVPKKVEVNIVGESLFNDGIGVVIFIIILQIIQRGINTVSFGNILLLFAEEALGGLAFGFVLGYITYRLLRTINDYQTEVMITLAIVMGGYYLATMLGVSGPLAMVVAGLFTGNRTKKLAMSDTSRLYLEKFWHLIDSLMNAILFVLIGLRLIVLDYKNFYLLIGLLIIPIVLLTRFLSIRLPLFISKKWVNLDKKDQLLMTWGGLRGGLSIAMALSLSQQMHRDLFVFITYIIVLFSILIQGLTVGKFAERLYSKTK
jgi:CPA1 family monovalent cation:H+ antiporter